jgi:hypothetical protein
MGNTGVNRSCHDCWRRALHLYLYAIGISAERKQLLTRALRSKSTCLDIFAVDLGRVPRFVKWAEPLAKYFSQTASVD